MASTTVRLSTEAHGKLAALAEECERPMSDLLAEMIERERRRVFLEGLNEDYARLRADPAEWAEYRAEIASLDGALMDGLEDDPWVE